MGLNLLHEILLFILGDKFFKDKEGFRELGSEVLSESRMESVCVGRSRRLGAESSIGAQDMTMNSRD